MENQEVKDTPVATDEKTAKVFAAHPSIGELYQTPDGYIFTTRKQADSWAAMSKQTVTVLKRPK